MWLGCANPASSAMSVRLCLPSINRTRARSTRRSRTKRCAGYAHGLFEQRLEVRHAESGHARQFGEREIFIEMGFDVLEHAAQPPRRQRATALGKRCSCRRLQGQQSNCKRRGQAIGEQAPTRITVLVFGLHHPADALDLRVSYVNRRSELGLGQRPSFPRFPATAMASGTAGASAPVATRSSEWSCVRVRRRTGRGCGRRDVRGG